MSFHCFHTRDYPKTLLFKSFTGLTQKFVDNVYDKEMAKRYAKHEIQRLSKKGNRERERGAERPFKLDLEKRFLMLLVYYRLYVTYTLVGFSLTLIKVLSTEIYNKRLKV